MLFFGSPKIATSFVVLLGREYWYLLKGLCKDISLHLHTAEKSKNSPLKLMAHKCCESLIAKENNAVFAHFLCSIYRAAYLPLYTPFNQDDRQDGGGSQSSHQGAWGFLGGPV